MKLVQPFTKSGCEGENRHDIFDISIGKRFDYQFRFLIMKWNTALFFHFQHIQLQGKKILILFLFHICNRLNKNILVTERPLTHKGLDTKGFCYHLSPARYFAGKGFVSGFLKRWERFVVLCQCTKKSIFN